jgi:DNA (cytosine-5)-methyltransferase 1
LRYSLTQMRVHNMPSFNFIDVFAGCGGLSLGLIRAGWSGLFAIEKNEHAFQTLKINLIEGSRKGFVWPSELPMQAMPTSELLGNYKSYLRSLKGQVNLLAGGPPCQGFSMAGRRTHSDPRNSLINDYINIVNILEPRFLLIENVQGFSLAFRKGISKAKQKAPYSVLVRERLEKLGYLVFTQLVDLSLYGVPQNRKRFILIAIRKGDPCLKKLGKKSPFDLLEKQRKQFLSKKELPTNRPVSAKEAIGDLEVSGKKLIANADFMKKGQSFKEITYNSKAFRSSFTKLVRKGTKSAPNSLRLAQHRRETIHQFSKLSRICERGKSIKASERKRLGLKKHALTVLGQHLPSATVTTLPDDIIHYSEPRILTVRENARLQTFPDWFEFTGPYTTGSGQRKDACPRYTQVGNAVPPLFAEAIGKVLKNLARA